MKLAITGCAAAVVITGLLSGCTTVQPTAADFLLPAPQIQSDRAYLGLANEAASFRLEDIRCELLVVDCFDMYCHLCQSGAAHVNELYRLAQEHGLGGRVKFVGLGAGDTPFEVSIYKEKLKVPFPVFSDRRAIIAKSLGPLRLPNLILLRCEQGRLEVIHSFPGVLRDPAEALSHIQAALVENSLRGWAEPVDAAQETCGEHSTSCRNPALLRATGATGMSLAPGIR